MKTPYGSTPIQDAKRVEVILKRNHVLDDHGTLDLYYNGEYCAAFRVVNDCGTYSMIFMDFEFSIDKRIEDLEILQRQLDSITGERTIGVKMVKYQERPDIISPRRWICTLQYKKVEVKKKFGSVEELKYEIVKVEKVQSFFSGE